MIQSITQDTTTWFCSYKVLIFWLFPNLHRRQRKPTASLPL